MIVRPSQLRPIPSFLLPFTQSPIPSSSRKLHSNYAPQQIPRPTPFVPNTQTFLNLIGRDLVQFAPKIPTWQDLFTINSAGLKKLGIQNPRTRRYLLQWTHRYRMGQHGIGGNMQYVKDGVALLKVVKIPLPPKEGANPGLPPPTKTFVANVAEKFAAEEIPAEQLKPINGFTIVQNKIVSGPHVVQMSDNWAKIEAKAGLWAFDRGRKIDGGERRRAEVRAKRRGEEKRAAAGEAR